MATIQASRFAALNVDEDSDDNQKSKNKQNKENKSQPQAAKKRNRKKKKADQNKAESDELRNLAFGGKSSGKKRTTSQSGGAGDAVAPEQWNQWRQVDEEVAQDEYEKDLQRAILESKLDFEEKKEVLSTVADQNGTNDKKNRKKKKDNKPAPMSLEQFNQLEPVKKKTADSDDEEILPAKPQLVMEVSEPDPTFFDNVKKDVAKTLQKERIQEEYKKQYAVESALVRQLREDLEQKNEIIDKLKKGNKELKRELKQAKDRTQQLCQILAKGEMKSKAEILKELDDSRRLHEELNQEVATLTQDLEKEKSKVHALTAELSAKHKGGKK